MIRDILKMGDPRLLRVAPPVAAERFGSAELQALIQDMFDTMAAAGGVGLAAPQIGEDLQLMVFGFEMLLSSRGIRERVAVRQSEVAEETGAPVDTRL